MLSITFTIIFLIIGIGLLISGKYYWSEVCTILGTILFIISTFILIIIFCVSIGIKSEWNAIKYDYIFTKELVENYERGDYGNTVSLTDKVLTINRTISIHKAYCHNPWFNVWYSDEIGNLEPLMLPNKDFKKAMEE